MPFLAGQNRLTISYGSQEFFNADKDVSFLIQRYRIGFQRPAAISDGKPVTQIENEIMQGADDLSRSHQTLNQWAAFVWAVRLGRVDTGVSRMEYGDELPADLEHPTLAARNL